MLSVNLELRSDSPKHTAERDLNSWSLYVVDNHLHEPRPPADLIIHHLDHVGMASEIERIVSFHINYFIMVVLIHW